MSTAASAAAVRRSRTHKIAVTAMLSAAATVLMFLEFPIPFLIPSFVELDFSELPALLADETCLAAACSAVLIEVEEPHADE